MKKLIGIFSVLACCVIYSQAAYSKVESKQKDIRKEYGIALVLPKEYSIETQRINLEIAKQVPKMANLQKTFHVTLFQGRFLPNQIEEIYQKLVSHNFKKIQIELELKIKAEKDSYINLPVLRNQDLQNIHTKVVGVANPYHEGVIARYADSYNDLNKRQQQQISVYGIPGLFDEYDPHVTLFYFSKKTSNLEKIVEKISLPSFIQKQEVSSIVIAELGYNGNIKKVLHEIELK